MKNSTFPLFTILIGSVLGVSSFAGDEKPQANDKIVCNKEYKIISSDAKTELGRFGIKGIFKEGEQKFAITETLSMDYQGKKVEYISSVVYKSKPSIAPESGVAETKVDGKICMKGTVIFTEKTINIECTGFLNKRTGEAINPPKKFERKDEPRPDAVLIFQSALLAIGPKLLPREGELRDIVFVEFPDDLGAPELIKFKKGYRLVRERSEEKGEYNLKIYSPYSDNSDYHIRFDKDDRITSIASFGQLKLLEKDSLIYEPDFDR